MLRTQLVTPYLREDDTKQKQVAQPCSKPNLPKRRHHNATERQKNRHCHAVIFPFCCHRPPNASHPAHIHSYSVAPNLLACRLLFPQMSAATYPFVGSCAQNMLNIKLLCSLK
ncbi:hypothetical protein [Prevotella falsenii]|uniref:hypothetical protein n=1 Tax=Prevotella falsenii TaxID=515414 RepID=UPI0012EBE429|nr:hypothetical protein [Prevotella falsenii]